MLEGINYLHAKFKINFLKNKKVFKLLEHWQLWLKEKKRIANAKCCNHATKKKIANTRVFYNTKNTGKITFTCAGYRPVR